MKRKLLFTGALLTVTVLIGCYTSKFTVGSPDDAKVDRAFVGDYELKGADSTASIAIRNIDDKNYYVEYRESPDKVSRYVGFVGKIKDAQFANLRELTDDGSISDDHLIMRIELKDNKLTLRNLKDDFFKDKTIGSQAQLVALLEENLGNDAMYDAPVVATRVEQPK
jgi:hypothetical protein